MSDTSAERTERVLVIDDDPPILELVCEMLAEGGYSAEGFSSTQAAATALRANPGSIAVVLSDVKMPDSSDAAAEMQQLIRSLERLGCLATLIVMSAMAQRNGGYGEGVTFLGKPFEMDALLDAVQYGIERSRERRKAARQN